MRKYVCRTVHDALYMRLHELCSSHTLLGHAQETCNHMWFCDALGLKIVNAWLLEIWCFEAGPWSCWTHQRVERHLPTTCRSKTQNSVPTSTRSR